MSVVVVLAMHGAPPRDFPRNELAEFFALHAHNETSQGQMHDKGSKRYLELESRIREWPRTEQNDPFHVGAIDMARSLEKESGCRVIVGFNEFCSPTIDKALDRAAALNPEKVIVVTPMMTRGGEHSERDIPKVIKHARVSNPDIAITYAWPFDVDEVARFLTTQVDKYRP
jgi:sirohydrochlorin cobaltochelatase